MSMITPEQAERIRDYLVGRHIPSGLGTKEEACSVAAINLALTGELTDNIPPCMSAVSGRWAIAVQDAMPDDIRNSEGWRELLPLLAGSGREPAREATRLAIIMDWMWGTVLPLAQPRADALGFGQEWATMTRERTAAAARAAAAASATAWATEEEEAAWAKIDPVGLLRRLVESESGRA